MTIIIIAVALNLKEIMCIKLDYFKIPEVFPGDWGFSAFDFCIMVLLGTILNNKQVDTGLG